MLVTNNLVYLSDENEVIRLENLETKKLSFTGYQATLDPVSNASNMVLEITSIKPFRAIVSLNVDEEMTCCGINQPTSGI